MFWRKKPTLRYVRMIECTPEQSAFRENVEREAVRRLALKKAQDDFDAAPNYRITSSYDVTKNEDTYLLQEKEFAHGWSAPGFFYRTIYASTDKTGVDARFKRLQASKVTKAA